VRADERQPHVPVPKRAIDIDDLVVESLVRVDYELTAKIEDWARDGAFHVGKALNLI
jgi:hypothetical protein